jgi:FkbH-like protein
LSRSRGVVISDFHTGNLVNLLNADPRDPAVEVHAAPFGQVASVLLDASAADNAGDTELGFAFVWTRPQAIIRGYADAARMQAPPQDQIMSEVDEFADQLKSLASRVPTVFVATWARDPLDRGLGILDQKHPEAPGRILRSMNERLVQSLDGETGVFLLDAERWLAAGGAEAVDPRLWYMAKIPYGADVFRAAVHDLKAGVRAVQGRAKKLLILDLDDTLWGGIVGETGWTGLRLGGHDPVGEAYVDFQQGLKALSRRGVILAIVSKNEPDVALEAIREHPEMVLRLDDFAGWRINWDDKARNVAELVEELNLGLDAAVFIDDNPSERGRVREALPLVTVPEWPSDPLRYPMALRALDLFDQAQLSSEDRKRARSYSAERERRDLRGEAGSMEDWLLRLDLVVEARQLEEADLPRAVQLLNKTNQMNLRTRRMSEAAFASWAEGDGRRVWTLRVRDRFSDAGLTGLVSVEVDGAEAQIEDFVLSCRVFGRGVERAMVHMAAGSASELGAERLVARHEETPRNAPCLEFFRVRSGFSHDATDPHRFVLDLARPYALPEHLSLSVH